MKKPINTEIYKQAWVGLLSGFDKKLQEDKI